MLGEKKKSDIYVLGTHNLSQYTFLARGFTFVQKCDQRI